MDIVQKINLLGEAAQYDLCRGCGTHSGRVRDDIGQWIYPAVQPDGKRVALLKVLQTNMCERDCLYCANRSQRDVPRTSFTPDELAAAFVELLRQRRVQGFFLSSGVCGGVPYAMDRMLATVELLRKHYRFGGYIHLKILPGADDASIEMAIKLANRVSVNLEAPNDQRLRALSGTKRFTSELLAPLEAAHRTRLRLQRPVSMTTQFVVGPAGESDHELLAASSRLYQQISLTRAYYSAFNPIPGTPLEGEPLAPTWREHRLYQADFLLRQYGFELNELVFTDQANLPRETDPKTAWALNHPEVFPVEINRASREQLLRVPGIGPTSVTRILARRRQARLCDLEDIKGTGADAVRAAPYILLNGRQPPYQLPLQPYIAP